MQDLKARVAILVKDFKKLQETLDLEAKKQELSKLEAKSTDPNLWDKPETARGIMQELGDLKEEIEKTKSLGEEIKTLSELSKEESLTADFEKEVGKTEKKLEKYKLILLLSAPYDKKNAIVSIHAGQGGTEAMDWVSMLYRMYSKYCEARKWKTQVVDLSEGEEAGIKSVTFKVQGAYSYGYLKGEAGTHRLVRQSPFNADKLRQTSFALVEVLPELEEVDLPDIQIKDEDLDWQFFRASTQGGQNVQKVSSAVRVKHKPTGIVATSQQERSQEQNRKIAVNLLRSKLWLKAQAKLKAEKHEIKGEYKPASWGTQIRSYVLHPYKMVKDLRTGVETQDTEGVLNGDLDQFIEAELRLGDKK